MTPPPTIVKTAETHHQKTSTPNGKIRGQQTVASTKYQDSVIEPSSPPGEFIELKIKNSSMEFNSILLVQQLNDHNEFTKYFGIEERISKSFDFKSLPVANVISLSILI